VLLFYLTYNYLNVKKDTAVQDKQSEIIIRQHKHWTRWLVNRQVAGEGNLILTNRRVLFLHRMKSSPELSDTIKRLADAPMDKVLDHALTLHKYCFDIPLESITRLGIGVFIKFPYPNFYLKISYDEGKKPRHYIAAFQFIRPKSQIAFHPQLIVDYNWMRALRRAMRRIPVPEKK
jgi:hypothetical protein